MENKKTYLILNIIKSRFENEHYFKVYDMTLKELKEFKQYNKDCRIFLLKEEK